MNDLPRAKQAFQQLEARVNHSSLVSKDTHLAMPLAGLTGVLVELGALDDAGTVARRALPLLIAMGRGSTVCDALALRLGLSKRWHDSARLLGFCDAATQTGSMRRDANRQRTAIALTTLLQEHLSTQILDSLLADGAQFSEAMAYKVAL